MSIADSASANGLLSTPLVFPAPLAGALAALILVMVVMLMRRSDSAIVPRLLVLVSVIAVCILVTTAILDRLEMSERTAEQRALLQRDVQLSVSAITSGSLACLDGVAGEQVENACEQAVFADAQSTAKAVAYVSARLSLLSDVAATARGDRDFLAAFTTGRRAIELDRYGIAAHVLSVRDGCTAERCAALAMFEDAAALKGNLKVRAFDSYVARYASAWDKRQPVADKEPQTSSVTPAPVANAAEPPSVAHPLDPKYDFPSSASIPAVSIMNAEPPPPKEPKEPKEQTGTATAHPPGEKPTASAPVPPKRPQAQAATPPAAPATR